MAEMKERALITAETKELSYTAADGQEIKLTPEIVRKYLVQGHGEMVTLQEIAYFLNICRSRKLNPFIKDCYLIKYSQGDPAAIVTSVDYFRKRARAMKDCKGWQSGIIVKDAEGKVKDTAGLLLDGETLLGGWFEATPEGWTMPLRLEVNLRGYIKKTKEGNITRFWSPENQPSQIHKVAESQGLRKLWPDEFQGLYSEEEIMDNRETIIDVDIQKKSGIVDIEDTLKVFDDSIPKGADLEMLNVFLTRTAEQNKVTIEAVKIDAAKSQKSLDDFWKFFNAWAKQIRIRREKMVTDIKSPDTKVEKPEKPEMAPGPCPDRDNETIMHKEYCDACAKRDGCPVWLSS